MGEPLPFHKWKDEQIKKDSEAQCVMKAYRSRDWYYTAYGAYCNKIRRQNAVHV